MDDQFLTAVVARAERVARNVEDQSLRDRAFEVILTRLLHSDFTQIGATENSPTARPATNRLARHAGGGGFKEPKSLSQRILALQDEGFFAEPKSIGSVREGLKAHGWHYPVTTLSGALQGFIQKRRLRREKVREGRKSIWQYSNP